jgi:phosphoribosylformylglycinamidine cyclo-ligase
MEIYLDPSDAERVIEIAAGYGVEAQIIGRIEEARANQLIIESEFGRFEYY